MLRLYAQAVHHMKFSRPASDPFSWTFQANTHWVATDDKQAEILAAFGSSSAQSRLLAEAMWATCRGHSGTSANWRAEVDWFTPWHRGYLFYFEAIVRSVLKADDFALPYWNYTSPASSALPDEFRMETDPVFSVLYDDTRSGPVNGGSPLFSSSSPPDLSSLSQRTFYRNGAEQGFNLSLDRTIHGDVHVTIGGNMGRIQTAANDPIFWLHHANIDRLWEVWLQLGNGRENPTDANWKDKAFSFAAVDQAGTATPVLAPTRDISDLVTLDYTYDSLVMAQVDSPERTSRAASLIRGASREMDLGAGRGAIQLPLPEFGLLTALTASRDGQRLFLVLDDLRADEPPGAIYSVLLSGANGEPSVVGTINFFDVAPRSAEPSEDLVSFYSFDVTDVMVGLIEAEGSGILERPPQVALVPTGEVAENSNAYVGRAFFALQ